tara:strand:- start:222 stop:371 length:150 start_codon:yes stop_codon:yes gene_type:complete
MKDVDIVEMTNGQILNFRNYHKIGDDALVYTFSDISEAIVSMLRRKTKN